MKLFNIYTIQARCIGSKVSSATSQCQLRLDITLPVSPGDYRAGRLCTGEWLADYQNQQRSRDTQGDGGKRFD